MDSNIYIVGSPDKLKEIFPQYNAQDARTLPDGRMIYKVNVAQAVVSDLMAIKEIQCFDHAGILAMLNDAPEAAVEEVQPKKKRGK